VPVAVKFIRAGAIAMLEWCSLRFVDNAPAVAWIATSIVALLVLAVLECRDWLNFKKWWYFRASISVLLVVWVVSVGVSYAIYGVAPDVIIKLAATPTTTGGFPSFHEAGPPPAGAGRLGPLSTLGMVDSIGARGNALSPSDFLDHKWALVVTFTKDNDYAAQVLRRIVGAKVETIPIPPPNPGDLDAPKLTGATEPGITLHGDNGLNSRLFVELARCFNIKKTGHVPDNLQAWYANQIPNDRLVDWIDIGPGSPWKEPFPCSE
jgi:hypothetical protein